MEPKPCVFDRQAALEIVDGRLDILVDLAGVFLDHFPQLLHPIDVAVRQEDLQALANAAHDLKGSMSFFGPSLAAATATELEQAATQGRLDVAARVYARLPSQMDDLAASLRQLIASF